MRKKDWNLILQEASENYKILIDEVDANTTYIGKAKHGTNTSDAQWQIKKISVSGTVTSISFANGDDAFNQIWDNRTSLSYS